MKKKVILRGPILTRSGYGEQTRFALRSLLTREDLFDIYLHPLNWGKTSWIYEDNEERTVIDHLIRKTLAYTQSGGQFDISVQCTIPNEWEKIAPVNVGYTAGIETTRVAPHWIEIASQVVDRVIVVSEHSKAGFVDTVHHGTHTETGQPMTLQLQKDYDIRSVGYPVKTFEQTPEIEIDVDTEFNFLCVAQMGPRKNLQSTIKWFYEEFHDNPAVGLILKTNIARNCLMDRHRIYRDLATSVKVHFPDAACKLYLLHGDMTDEEMHSLYKHDAVDAFCLFSHGEGFGLPYFEAAYSGLPVIAPGWSGHMDFLCDQEGKEHFYNVGYDIQTVPKEVVWEGVIIEDSMWANAREKSAKKMMRQCYEDFTGENKSEHIAAAAEYATHLKNRFSPENMHEKFVEGVYEPDEEVEGWLSELEEMVNV